MGLGLELPSQVFRRDWHSYKPGDRYANKDLVVEPTGAARTGLPSCPKLCVGIGS